jgi:endonuclease III related protein
MANRLTAESAIQEYFLALNLAWGPQHWWPAETRFEVIVGAYLTQNTAWTNVERALSNLRAAGLLNLKGIRSTKLTHLERLIRPSGYFRQKAKRLKTFVHFLDQKYGGSLDRMFSQRTETLRTELLDLKGVGPETADSILLYAGNHPVFVIDAYTRRILDRHNILAEKADYEEIRLLFQRSLTAIAGKSARAAHGHTSLSEVHGTSHRPSAMSTRQRPPLVQIYNEMHGLIVGVGKNFCRKSQPQCDGCPLQTFLPSVK